MTGWRKTDTGSLRPLPYFAHEDERPAIVAFLIMFLVGMGGGAAILLIWPYLPAFICAPSHLLIIALVIAITYRRYRKLR